MSNPVIFEEPRIQQAISIAKTLNAVFKDHSESLYLVGGSVRDMILFSQTLKSGNDNEKIYDLDYATSSSPEKTIQILKTVTKDVFSPGQKFGTVACKYWGLVHEITTYRGEVYTDESRKPIVSYSKSLEDDLMRRDFTINSMALDLDSLEVIDPFGGTNDLKRRLLRTPRSPNQSFSEDPLRMLRAARFLSQLDLTADKSLFEATSNLKHRLKVVSAERIRDELNKLLVLKNPEKGLRFLVETGLFEVFMPEIPALRLEQDPIHRHKDVLEHTIQVVVKTSPKLTLRLAALFHDVGKPATRSFEGGKVSFHGHDIVGAKITRKRLRELRYPNDIIKSVSNLVALHLRFHSYALGWTDKAVRRYVRDAGDLLEDLNELTRCDCTTRNERKAEQLAQRMDELEKRIVEIQKREELANIRPQLNGQEIMEILNISPSPKVGEVLKWLMEIRLDEGIIDRDELIERLIKKFKP